MIKFRCPRRRMSRSISSSCFCAVSVKSPRLVAVGQVKPAARARGASCPGRLVAGNGVWRGNLVARLRTSVVVKLRAGDRSDACAARERESATPPSHQPDGSEARTMRPRAYHQESLEAVRQVMISVLDGLGA